MISNLAAECRMPLCYGGGIKTVKQIERVIALGVEKVSISSSAVKTPNLISEAAKCVGSQSVVVVMDVKKSGIRRRYEVYTNNGTKGTGLDPAEVARRVEDYGAGEVVVNSIDSDGEMKGYDLELISKVREAITLPLTVLGGAGSIQDMNDLITHFGIIGAAAGSLFVFKGKYRAVLINYPIPSEKELLY